jgi:two-component system response regulator DevR
MKRTRVLVLDALPLLRQGMHQVLEGQGDFEVVGIDLEPDDAVAAARTLAPDVVFIDLEPDPGADERLLVLKRELPKARFIALTSVPDQPAVAAAIGLGVDAVLQKRTSPDAIALAARMVRRGDSFVISSDIWRTLYHALPASGACELLHTLTPRERDVLQLVERGATDAAIAQALFLSVRTVNRHVSHILQKLGVSSRREAARLSRMYRGAVV